MRGQQRRADIDQIVQAELAGNQQHFLFGLGIQSVSRFDFNGRYAFIHQPLEPLLCHRQEHFRRTVAGRRDRGVNTAALRADGLIRHAVKPLFPFRCAIAAEHQMGVAIDQAGSNQTPVEIDTLTMPGGDLGFRNNGRNRLAAHDEGMLFFQTIGFRLTCCQGRQSRISPYHIIGMKLLHVPSACHGLYRHLFSSVTCCQPPCRKMLFICDDFPVACGQKCNFSRFYLPVSLNLV